MDANLTKDKCIAITQPRRVAAIVCFGYFLIFNVACYVMLNNQLDCGRKSGRRKERKNW